MPRKSHQGWPLVGALGTVVVVLLAFSFTRSTSFWAFPRFLLATALVTLVPGALILDVLRLRPDRIERGVLAFVLGMLASTVVYSLAFAVHVPLAFTLWIVASAAALLVRGARRGPLRLRPLRLRTDHAWLAVVIAIAMAPVLVMPVFWASLKPAGSGGRVFAAYADPLFHSAIAQALTHTVPPPNPFFANEPLSYHYAADVLTAMIARFGGLAVHDVSMHFLPLLLVAVAVLSAYAFARAWLGSALGGVLAALLVVLAEDFSFVPGLINHSPQLWTQYFHAPTVFSLYSFNPMLPALSVAMVCLLCLLRFFQTKAVAWAVAAAICAILLPEYKVFTGALLIAAMGIVGMVIFITRRDRWLVGFTAIVLLASAAIFAVAVRGGILETEITFSTWTSLWVVLIHDPGLAQLIADWTGTAVRQTSVPVTLGLGVPVYLVGSLGMRVVGLPRIVNGAGTVPRELRLIVAAIVVLGFALWMTVHIVTFQYDNSVFFYVSAKYVLAVLAVETAVLIWRRGRRRLAAVLATALIALSLPAAVQTLNWMSVVFALDKHPPLCQQSSAFPIWTECVLTEGELATFGALNRLCDDGEVALAPPYLIAAMVALTRCRGTHADVGLGQSFFPAQKVLARERELKSFWDDYAGGVCQAGQLTKYNVRLLAIPARLGNAPASCGSIQLQTVFSNGEYEVALRVRPAVQPQP